MPTKTISNEVWQLLEDLSAESWLGGLPLATAEKDIHVTDLLLRLSTLQVRHGFFRNLARGETTRMDDGITLVFAGGTCLSKGHQLIHRMSEDIDIKVMLTPPTTGQLRKSAGSRARLKALHRAVEALLSEMGFDVPPALRGAKNPEIGDSHRYYLIGAAYASKAPTIASLRPELKLELIHREPQLAPVPLTFGYLYDSMAQGKLTPAMHLTMPCLQVAETLAEKVLSLLRRCALEWFGDPKAEMDPALVRHIYDVYRIMAKRPQELAAAQAIFPSLVAGDAAEFKARHQDFDTHPKEILLRALSRVANDDALRSQYLSRVQPLVYDGLAVPYETAFEGFNSAAMALIATLADNPHQAPPSARLPGSPTTFATN
nr:nucleotidyl transferase AbiEii/AbiGii toxin family protein [uncultured Albidiferax sp.]